MSIMLYIYLLLILKMLKITFNTIKDIGANLTALNSAQTASRSGIFFKMLGLQLSLHAYFLHETRIGLMQNFWEYGVVPMYNPHSESKLHS